MRMQSSPSFDVPRRLLPLAAVDRVRAAWHRCDPTSLRRPDQSGRWFSLHDSIWLKDAQYKPLQFYHMDWDSLGRDQVFDNSVVFF